ncbi:TIMELESS-interacting protein [Cucumis sativus]|uniref:CCHC-type domain-containing protein n=1 Tax=Cucumis sativus TaxID=3659 RepID=A0A0A0LI96_CUCSA|nr:TIMELESS-interacting protein [Cucumis sativus]KGN60764.1 hypothetical protein Csa_019321 [Cucumis sativus]
MEKDNNAVPAPTGCFKCGKPGHWSRDCPSSAPNPNPTSNSSTPSFSSPPAAPSKAVEKPKKAPRTRPKLTPELLLSDDGLGYVLRHFPRAFKYRGRGHEINDLENLIGLYREWHSHILPYYSFEHFVHKVEQVAATKRVKMCLGELRERVARGGDPTKWREAPILNDDDDDVNNEKEAKDPDDVFDNQEEASLRNNGADDIEEDMLQEVYEKATEEPLQNEQSDSLTIGGTMEGVANQEPKTSNSSETSELTEEQRVRMEANRLKALERAAAKARSLPTV